MTGLLQLGLAGALLRPKSVFASAYDSPILLQHQIEAVVSGLRSLADPLSESDASRLLNLAKSPSESATLEIDQILASRTFARLQLDKQGVGIATRGIDIVGLAELGWRSFLIRVENPFRLTGPLAFWSDVAIAEGDLQLGIHESHILGNDVPESTRAPVDLDTDFERGPAQWIGYRIGSGGSDDRGLQGLPLEYQILQLYSQRGGTKSERVLLLTSLASASRLLVDAVGFSANFRSQPANTVALSILDPDGRGTMASLLIYDEAGRLYPAPAHRLEPDLGYQPHVYRADGETLRLPVGQYTLTAARGPEYLESHEILDVPVAGTHCSLSVQLQRWFDATRFGWYPGDPHIHPEGQVYGVISKYGLTAETMYRQVCGEALSVGSILIWTGGYYYEKQFLTGHVYDPTFTLPYPEKQHANNVELIPRLTPHGPDSLIRYDVEQAAFPSNRLGHLVLLGLKNHDYPRARSIYDWPSWNLPILRWARAQGAVCGFAHIGSRMSANPRQLPSYEVPLLNGLGANECLVDVTHGIVDFVAGGESSPGNDLNPWYHLLNCGFQLPMIGETDFTYAAARAGAARTYVKLSGAPRGDAGHRAWIEGIRTGHVYFGDGRSHFIDYSANGRGVGEGGLSLVKAEKVTLSCSIACRLEPTPIDLVARQRRDSCYTYWHIERARIESTRRVLLEVVVNGHVVETHELLADGELREFKTTIDVARSSWIALRILPSGHTTPIFVSVGGHPIRASRRSAQWCLDCLEVLWQKLSEGIRETERDAAAQAWDHARQTYRRILSESSVD